MTTRKERLSALISTLSPTFVEIVDETKYHHVPKDGETHFKLKIVSAKFTNLSKLNRHRLINDLVEQELKSGLHALQLQLLSPEEWGKQPDLKSPSCRDGYRK